MLDCPPHSHNGNNNDTVSKTNRESSKYTGISQNTTSQSVSDTYSSNHLYLSSPKFTTQSNYPEQTTTATADLICLSHLRWNFVYQRPQHLLSRCAQGRRVFFVEEPIVQPDVSAHLQVSNPVGNVWVAVPHLPEALSETDSTELQKTLLDNLLSEHRIEHYICWYYTPMAIGFTHHLKPLAIVYDCMDELSAFKNAPSVLKQRETYLFKKADLVFTGGQSLYEAKREQHPSIYAFPSSVEVAHFAKARTLTTDPADQANIPHPRLGFYGVIDEHLGCTREEQLRWLDEVWQAAQELHQDGLDIRAVTVWSLLGAYDWNSLVTRSDGFYEPGVFDLRSPTPRSTALADMIRYLANGQTYTHPLLAVPGWWQRDDRLLHPPVNCTGQGADLGADLESDKQAEQFTHSVYDRFLFSSFPSTLSTFHFRPLLITGATGTLGQAFARICDIRGIPYVLASRQAMDITNYVSVRNMLAELNPWAVINAAGYVRVDDAEREPHLCWSANAEGAVTLAKACLHREIALVTFSSDFVFDGSHNTPYLESSPVSPLNIYGLSKATSEEWVLSVHPYSLVIRTSAFFGPWDKYNFLTIALLTLAAGETFRAAEDTTVSPTYVPDLVNATLDLLIDGECGIWHLANTGATSWADLARLAAKQAGLNVKRIEAHPSESLGWTAPRPAYSVLGSERATLLPSLDHAIHRYLHEKEV